MKKVIVALAATLVAAVGAQSAQAVSCHTFSCVNRQLNRLQRQEAVDRQALRTLFTCLANDVPLSQYGAPPASGYVYDQTVGGSALATAVDFTASGDSVAAWVVTNSCDTRPTAAPRLSRAGIRRGCPVRRGTLVTTVWV